MTTKEFDRSVTAEINRRVAIYARQERQQDQAMRLSQVQQDMRELIMGLRSDALRFERLAQQRREQADNLERLNFPEREAGL